MNTTDFIIAAHRGRNPALLALKWAKLKSSPIAFFRGTAPLFYANWSREPVIPSPSVWICGDAHLENVGSYKGANRVAYFDLNDFDEACLAPVHWELGRALTGLILLQEPLLAKRFLSIYRAMLIGGKPQHIEPETAKGVVATLLEKVETRKRRAFLAERVHGGRIRLKEGRSFLLDASTKKRILRVFEDWASQQAEPDFYTVKDLCGRIAGNGSLGLERFIVLVRGGKLPHLIDLKQAAPSAIRPVLAQAQPAWENEAERIATVQHFMQYVPVAHLGWTASRPTAYVVRELQPSEDRIDSTALSHAGYTDFVEQWARLVASAHLRSGGWRGSENLDGLIKFGQTFSAVPQQRLMKAAVRAAHHQREAFRAFQAEVK